MSNGIFVINERYRVYPALNQVQDIRTGEITRLEPRIMFVLEHLSQRAGQLVKREEMIRDIWHNYGGGDEGLSQAISFLRKTLGDQQKSLIQTIPKKGYCLTAVLRKDFNEQSQLATRVNLVPNMRSLFKYAVLFYVLSTAVYFIYNGLHLPPTKAEQSVPLVTHTKLPMLPVAVQPGLKKFSMFAVNAKTKPLTIRLNDQGPVSNKILQEPADNPPTPILANTETQSYHYSDKNAQITTALDYVVTTTLKVSTTLN